MAIARPEQHGSALCAKFNGSVEAGAELLVAANDACVFARYGAPIRIVGPGSYQVPAEFAGPDVEAWFVRTAFNIRIQFGGTLGQIRMARGVLSRAMGEYALRVTEPVAFFQNCGGQARDVVPLETVTGFVSPKLLGALAPALAGRAQTFNPSHLADLANEVAVVVNKELLPMGLQVEIANLSVME